MDSQIETVLQEYEKVLTEEFLATAGYDTSLAVAYTSGQIDGKNDAARKAQETALLQKEGYAVRQAEIKRKVIEARIGLMKASLYARSVIDK